MILLDLQKAFSTIDHEILLHKLKTIRFSRRTIQCFRSYVSERIVFVNTESKTQILKKNFCGVAQGFILGVILFFIYVNDMPQTVKSTLVLCAGDS